MATGSVVRGDRASDSATKRGEGDRLNMPSSLIVVIEPNQPLIDLMEQQT